MQRFARQAAVALVLATVAVGSAAGSTGVRPPRGTPDLSKMALRASDLPRGAKVAKQGYVHTTSVAEYDRVFAPRSARIGGQPFVGLENDISLETSSVAAASEFAQLRRLLSSKSGRQQLADELQRQLGLDADFVRVSAPFRFGAGQESLAVTITVGTVLGTIQATLAFFRTDRVVAIFALAGDLGAKLSHASLTALTRPVAKRVSDGLVPSAATLPSVGGNAVAGQTLTVAPNTWSNGPVSLAYQWQRCDATGANCVDVAGAASATYLLLDDDAGSTVRVEVTATNAFGSATKASAVTAVVGEPAGAPMNLQPPAVIGPAASGQTLTASPGVWVGKPTAYAYQWQRCDMGGGNCVPIDGAVSAAYVVSAADSGTTLRVAVTATNGAGSATVLTAQTAAVP